MNSPFVIVIFGATGDLALHKLLPDLYSLYKNKLIGEKFYIVGFARRELSDEDYRAMIHDLDFPKDGDWEGFAKNIYYQQGFCWTPQNRRLVRSIQIWGLCI